ncbi:MAG: tetratricopeptide repeat protein, partial [Thermoanaerobaculia bacterium]
MQAASSIRVLASAVLLAGSVGGACARPADEPADSQVSEIPISTSSEEAREAFVQGRDLNERLRGTDAHGYFERAVELDPEFAWAHLLAGFTGSTNQEFFDSLARAVALVDGVSEGERLLILATQAGVDGEPEEQRAHLTRLVERYPADKRTHNALGGFHFGRQEYQEAIGHYQHAIELDPTYSAPYNQMGYAHRFLGDFEAAEAAFQRYIQLIPDDPNPYDSYAELLMKTGRFEESIDNYRRALEADENFIASYSGIAHNQAFLGRGEAARETLATLRGKARNVGEERASLFWTVLTYVHEADYEAALASCGELRSLAEGGEDWAAVSGDLNLAGDLLLAAGRLDEASASYDESIAAIERANVRDEVKQNVRRNIQYDRARVLLARGALDAAREIATAYGEAVSTRGIPFEVRQHRELEGRLALAMGDAAGAVTHLEQANQQNPRVLLLLAEA